MPLYAVSCAPSLGGPPSPPPTSHEKAPRAQGAGGRFSGGKGSRRAVAHPERGRRKLLKVAQRT
eukprot:735252-Alexandrium_andersonii.AAC.1